MKRILHVFANLNLGGAESRIMDIYRHIDKDKTQFDFLILTNEECFFDDEIKALGGKIYKVTHPRKNIYKHCREVLFVLKENKFTAVHSHTSYFSGLIIAMAWACKVPYRVSHARNQFIAKKSVVIKSFFLLGRGLCNVFSTSKLAISEDAGQFLFGSNSRFIVVPNAFEYSKVKFHSRESSMMLSGDFINIVMVARLVPIKNHFFAISLVKKINDNNKKKIKLYLIGAGSEEEELMELVKGWGLTDSVIFCGRRTDVCDILCQFDFLILPSFAEGLGVAALEGQAAGLPCLVSKGVPEEVDLGLGLIKRLSLDLDLWEKIIFEFNRDNGLSKKMINETFADKNYSLESVASIYLSKYGINI